VDPEQAGTSADPNQPQPPVVFGQVRYLSGMGIHGQAGVTTVPPDEWPESERGGGSTLTAMGSRAGIGVGGNGRGVVPWARYLHGDLIGSTMLTTDESGGAVSAVSYTAFGEVVIECTDDQGQLHCQVGGALPAEPGGVGVSPANRYWYAGAWGYETGGFPPEAGGPPGSDPNRGIIALYGPDPDLPPITLMHVGYRWYDPALGRFTQRDPVAPSGGLNGYLYCQASPAAAMDPRGLWTDDYVNRDRGPLPVVIRPQEQTLGDELKTIKHFRTCVKAVAALGAIFGPPPVDVGCALGLLGIEACEEWLEDEDERLEGGDTVIIE